MSNTWKLALAAVGGAIVAYIVMTSVLNYTKPAKVVVVDAAE